MKNPYRRFLQGAVIGILLALAGVGGFAALAASQAGTTYKAAKMTCQDGTFLHVMDWAIHANPMDIEALQRTKTGSKVQSGQCRTEHEWHQIAETFCKDRKNKKTRAEGVRSVKVSKACGVPLTPPLSSSTSSTPLSGPVMRAHL